MFPNLSSIVASLLFTYCYILLTYLDYNKSKSSYINFRFSLGKTIFDAYPNVFRNIVIVTPLTLLILLNIVEIEVLYYSLMREFITLITHILWIDFYYWSLHYMTHKYKFLYRYLHKKHHEFRNSIGFMAFYADISEIVLFNLGGSILFHVFYRFSMYHIILLIIGGTYTPIMSAHTSTKIDKHQIHHLIHKNNYGFNVFMDKLMRTELTKEKYLENIKKE